MSNSLISRSDLDFLLHDWLNVEDLADRDLLNAFLDLSEKLAANQFLSHYKHSDIDEPMLARHPGIPTRSARANNQNRP